MEEASTLVTNIMAGISLIVSIVLAMYYIRDRRVTKLSVESEYIRELLGWSNEVLKVLGHLRLAAKKGHRENVDELRNELSTLIDIGRFFFPNIDKGDNFGSQKPPAFRGYRNLSLDFLVAIHNIYKDDLNEVNISLAERMRRHFLSVVFEIVNPRDRLRRIRSITDRYFVQEQIFEDYLAMDDNAFKYIWRS